MALLEISQVLFNEDTPLGITRWACL